MNLRRRFLLIDDVAEEWRNGIKIVKYAEVYNFGVEDNNKKVEIELKIKSEEKSNFASLWYRISTFTNFSVTPRIPYSCRCYERHEQPQDESGYRKWEGKINENFYLLICLSKQNWIINSSILTSQWRSKNVIKKWRKNYFYFCCSSLGDAKIEFCVLCYIKWMET